MRWAVEGSIISFEVFPNDVLGLILELLGPPSIFNLCLASRSFQLVVPTLVHKLTLSDRINLESFLNVSSILLVQGARFTGLQTLELFQRPDDITLGYSSSILVAVGSLPSLTVLRLRGVSLTSQGLRALEALLRLDHLELVSCNFSGQVTKKPPLWRDKIVKLHFVFTEVPQEWMPRLSQSLLSFVGTGLTPTHLDFLAECPNLSSLGLIDTHLCQLRASRCAWNLIFPKIKNLAFFGCDVSTRDFLSGYSEPPLLDALGLARGLQGLSILSSWIRDPFGPRCFVFDFEALARHWPCLIQRLELSPASRIPFDSLLAALSHSTRLTSLRLTDIDFGIVGWEAGLGHAALQANLNPAQPQNLLHTLKSLPRLRQLVLPRLNVFAWPPELPSLQSFQLSILSSLPNLTLFSMAKPWARPSFTPAPASRHSIFSSEELLTPCPHGCGQQSIPSDSLLEHREEACSLRPRVCIFGCSQRRFSPAEFRRHTLMGDCPLSSFTFGSLGGLQEEARAVIQSHFFHFPGGKLVKLHEGDTLVAPSPSLLLQRYSSRIAEIERESCSLFYSRCPLQWMGCNFAARLREASDSSSTGLLLPSVAVTKHLLSCRFAVYACLCCGRDVGRATAGDCGRFDCKEKGRKRCSVIVSIQRKYPSNAIYGSEGGAASL